MAKNRDQSHIMTIQSDESVDATINAETAVEALIEQRSRLKELLKQIEGDLESLGYTFDEPQT